MGNIVNDIVDEINVKPHKSKLYIKWIISIAGTLIALAFVFGQFKASFFDRMDSYETSIVKNTAAITNLETKVDERFNDVDVQIDKIYSDGLQIFNDYQGYNRKQLELVIDYGGTNNDMLKRMLEISEMEQKQNAELRLEQLKNEAESPTYRGEVEFSAVEEGRDFSIGVTPMKEKPFIKELYLIQLETNDTTFNITAATQNYINSIDKNQYELGAIIENNDYPGRYDFSYRKRK